MAGYLLDRLYIEGYIYISPSAAPSYFHESHWRSEISSLSKVILVLGKARSCRAPNLGGRGLGHTSGLMLYQKNSEHNVMHEQALCPEEVANHQLPIAAAFWIIPIVSREECSSLMQNMMQIDCSTHSVILSVMTTQYTCSLNGIYPPPPRTSIVRSSLFTHVHSSPLSLAARSHGCHANCSSYINNGWTFSRQTLYGHIFIFSWKI